MLDETDKELLEEIGSNPGIDIPELKEALPHTASRTFLGVRINGLEQDQLIEGKYRPNSTIGWYLTPKGEKACA